MAVIVNQGLRITVAPASDVDAFKAVGETFDAMACPVTEVLLQRLGGRAYTIGDSWSCRFTFGYIDSSGDLQPIDISAWLDLMWNIVDQSTNEVVFTRKEGESVTGAPGWQQIELEDAANGVVRVRISNAESLATVGGMYRHEFYLPSEGPTTQVWGAGPFEMLPARPS